MAEMYHLLNDKDFFNDFRESLKTLWVTGDYSDITLVSDDLIPFKTHKLVICSQSIVLNKIVKFLPDSNSVLFLKGINSKDLDHLLEYLYLGQLTLSKGDIRELKTTAENLRISSNFEFFDDPIKNKVMPENETKNCVSFRDKMETLALERTLHNYIKDIDSDLVIKRTFDNDPIYEESKEVNSNRDKMFHTMNDENNKYPKDSKASSNDKISKNDVNLRLSLIPEVKLKQDSNGFFLCGFCDYKSKNLHHVRRHENIHKGIKYKCPECDNEFAQLESVGLHVKSIHFPEKSKCNKCHKEFKNIRSKYVHECQRLLCDQCEKSFPNKHGLREHIKTKHEGKVYPCNQCQYKAGTNTHLKTHIRLKHAQSENLLSVSIK